MNSLTIVAIAIVVLVAGYALYGRWLAKTWGIDPNAKTPAYTHEDGEDYIPTPKAVVFSHQFSSIAGAGPVTGAIQAAVGAPKSMKLTGIEDLAGKTVAENLSSQMQMVCVLHQIASVSDCLIGWGKILLVWRCQIYSVVAERQGLRRILDMQSTL